MALSVYSSVALVTASLTGPGRVEMYAVRRAGTADPEFVIEAYDLRGMVAGGTVAVWELNQALAAIMSDTTQARRLALRDDGRGDAGYLDVVAGDDGVDVVASSKDGLRQAAFTTTSEELYGDLNRLLKHYLALQRHVPVPRSVVLPDAFSSRGLARR